MDSPVGARYEVCYEFGGSVRVLAEPGRSFSRPLCSHGHGGLGREVPCRMPPIPSATIQTPQSFRIASASWFDART